MTDGVDIRPATLADAATLAHRYRDAYETAAELGFPTWLTETDPAVVAAWIRNDRVFVAVDGGRLVGAVRYRTPAPYYGADAEFGRLAVPKTEQGQGIATSMVSHVERVAGREGYDCMRLRTFADHPFLVDFYRALGYHETVRRPIASAKWDVLHMVKPLRFTVRSRPKTSD